MQIQVLFFGVLRDLAGKPKDSLELPEGSTVADLLAHYEARIPKLHQHLSSLAMSVNQEYASPDARLRPNDEVGLLPPVSGGARRVAIVRTRIETEKIAQEIKRAEDGAVVVFEGIVRNHTRGRRTMYLDYEAYEEMALKKMEGLTDEALEKYQVRDVALVHRLGKLEIGETSVLIVVASGHRGAAFEACRWLIDTLKKTVPIWKKEHFEDGVVWADGEAFPAEIPRAEGSPSARPASK